jgi:hypothetical protein
MAKREQPEPGTMGARVLEIRSGLGMDTLQFADELNRIAGKLGHERTWSASKVSRATNNTHRMKLDEAVDLVTVARPARSLDWLVFGIEKAATSRFPRVASGKGA